MAITISHQAGTAPGRSGRRQLWIRGQSRQNVILGEFALDSSYPTGGYDISALFSEFNAESSNTNIVILVGSRAGYVFDVDFTNKKLLAYRQTAATGALAEVANAVNLSAVTRVPFVAFGVFA